MTHAGGAASEAQACRNRRGHLLQVTQVSAGLGLALRPEKQRWEGNTHMRRGGGGWGGVGMNGSSGLLKS